MNRKRKQEILRQIPPVDEILADPRVADLRQRHPRVPWTRLVRDALSAFRSLDDPAAVLDSDGRSGITDWAAGRVRERVGQLQRGGLSRVLNGTGVVLHTNLGRAPWGDGMVAAARDAMAGYVSLEVDLETGGRSRRGELLEELLVLATGAEAAMVVNNNAAAVYLAVNSFCPPGRVIVSRGEMVEIGGSFRLPEILRHATRDVVEVGTTNRTYADDYRKVARAGDILLKVHKSNYTIEGFAHEPAVAELADVAREVGAHCVYDLGSGALFDFRAGGFGTDPTVAEVVAAGVDAVTMSADKLMGAAQAGVIAGTAAFVAGTKQNPLRRAVRVDKVTIAALQEVLRAHLFAPEQGAGVPAIAQIRIPVARQVARAEAVAAGLEPPAGHEVTVSEDEGAVGGGSLSTTVVASAAVVIRCPDDRGAKRLAQRMRLGDPALFARIRGNEVRVNMTAILPGEEDALREAIADALETNTDE